MAPALTQHIKPCALLQDWCAGFVCRAKFITGSVAQLVAKPGGGSAWLLGLRDVPYPEAAAALCTLPGIGPKVPWLCCEHRHVCRKCAVWRYWHLLLC